MNDTGKPKESSSSEPVFTIPGSDPTAALVVIFWACMKKAIAMRRGGEFPDGEVVKAQDLSLLLMEWAEDHGQNVEEAIRAIEPSLRLMAIAFDVQGGLPDLPS